VSVSIVTRAFFVEVEVENVLSSPVYLVKRFSFFPVNKPSLSFSVALEPLAKDFSPGAGANGFSCSDPRNSLFTKVNVHHCFSFPAKILAVNARSSDHKLNEKISNTRNEEENFLTNSTFYSLKLWRNLILERKNFEKIPCVDFSQTATEEPRMAEKTALHCEVLSRIQNKCLHQQVSDLISPDDGLSLALLHLDKVIIKL